MKDSYAIVMFAHNEESNISNSLSSLLDNCDERLHSLFVIANGCTDKTPSIVQNYKHPLSDKITLIELVIGDKCNAWNEYIYSYAPDCLAHFFVDADVHFSEKVFSQLFETLLGSPEADAVAGLPLSGRNREEYLDMVKNRSCLFGNCYGLKNRFLELIRSENFRLPIGLCWIDSAITKIINSNVGNDIPRSNRIVYKEDSGYFFESLSYLKPSDWKLYKNRITRYRLGKLQEKYLEQLDFKDWPRNLSDINAQVLQDISRSSWFTNLGDKLFVTNKIKKELAKLSRAT